MLTGYGVRGRVSVAVDEDVNVRVSKAQARAKVDLRRGGRRREREG